MIDKSTQAYIDESMSQCKVINLCYRRKKLPKKGHLKSINFLWEIGPNHCFFFQNNYGNNGKWTKRIGLTIHLRPGVADNPVCRFTNEVWRVNLNLEGSNSSTTRAKTLPLQYHFFYFQTQLCWCQLPLVNWYSRDVVSNSQDFHLFICSSHSQPFLAPSFLQSRF